MTARRSSVARVDEDSAAARRRQLRGVAPRGAGGRRAGSPPRRSAKLSAKELLVLHELARGHTTEEVGQILLVSPHTVRTHIKNGMRKLGARTRAHAVAIAISDGAIALD